MRPRGGSAGGVATDTGLENERWNEELILQRYETLWEARLVPESGANGAVPGEPMAHDHRRILATGIARLRAKIKYRPVVFELMPPSFTLLQLQLSPRRRWPEVYYMQNFRRLIDQQDLVEETEQVADRNRWPRRNCSASARCWFSNDRWSAVSCRWCGRRKAVRGMVSVACIASAGSRERQRHGGDRFAALAMTGGCARRRH